MNLICFLEDLIIDNNDMQTVANEVCYYYGLEHVDIATEGIKEFFSGWKDRIIKWWNEWLKPKLVKLYNMLAKVFPFLKKRTNNAKMPREVAEKVVREIPKLQEKLSDNANTGQQLLQEITKVAQKDNNVSAGEVRRLVEKSESIKAQQANTSSEVNDIVRDNNSSSIVSESFRDTQGIDADKVINAAETNSKKFKADTERIVSKGATIEKNAVDSIEKSSSPYKSELSQAAKTASAVVHQATVEKAALSQRVLHMLKTNRDNYSKSITLNGDAIFHLSTRLKDLSYKLQRDIDDNPAFNMDEISKLGIDMDNYFDIISEIQIHIIEYITGKKGPGFDVEGAGEPPIPYRASSDTMKVWRYMLPKLDKNNVAEIKMLMAHYISAKEKEAIHYKAYLTYPDSTPDHPNPGWFDKWLKHRHDDFGKDPSANVDEFATWVDRKLDSYLDG